MKTRKRIIYKIAIAMLLPIIVLGLFISKTYAYNLADDGNIYSNNLLNVPSEINLYNGDYVFYNVDISLNVGTYTLSFDFSGNASNAQFKVYNDYEDQPVYDRVFNIVNGQNTLTFSINVKCKKVLLYSNATGTYTNSMINVGTTPNDYEAYGYWINSDSVNKQSLYSLFNNTVVTLEAYYQSEENSYTCALETLHLDVNQKYITLDDMPEVKRVINEGRSGEDWLSSGTTYYITLYLANNQFNGNLIFGDFTENSQYIALTGSSYGLYNKKIFSTYDNQAFLINTGGVEYTTLRIYNELGLNPNFRLSVSFSSSDYNLGYSDGYSKGYSSGVSGGNNNGYITGYNEGFNDGANTSLETNGMKTLFNSILSFPVNMIKSVFDFEFMGINVASVIMFIVSIGIVIFVVKKFKE